MVKIDIQQKEIDALDIVLKEAKVSVVVGFLVGSLRGRIQQAIQREQEILMREKYGEKKKDKNTKA